MASKHLLQSFALGPLQLNNRVVLAPLTRGRSGDSRVPNDVNAEYYAQRASAGLLITEATAISAQGFGWAGAPGIYTEEHKVVARVFAAACSWCCLRRIVSERNAPVPLRRLTSSQAGWKKVTDAVHAKGGKIFLQLWHMGRASHSSFLGGELPVSASAIAINGTTHTAAGAVPYETPRALEESEIPGVVADYKAAAALSMAAGFDGVEIHAANGYLIDQFLQSKSNLRNDGYGGSIEKRCRLLQEVVAAVTSVVPADRVGVRIAPNGV
jgi:N-ethylmaleimide reductase